MTINKLFFNENYNNKLKCDVLTTIRLEDQEKFKIGNRFDLRHKAKGNSINYGTFQVIEHRVLRQEQIQNWTTQLDCAMNVTEFISLMRTLYPDQITDATLFSVVLLKKQRAEIIQESLF